MLKILIIEDEEPAAKRLLKMIREIEPGVKLLDILSSVSSAIKWFQEHDVPDLIFSDIQLADGSSFDIFKAVEVNCPVIFVTAFDQFAIEAFKLNSVDYLLKPLKQDGLQAAISKFKRTQTAATPAFDMHKILMSYNNQVQTYKTRFIVRYGEHIKTINTEDIAYFYTEAKTNFLTSFEGRRFAIDFHLDNLASLLDPKIFFRINRQFVISLKSIEEMFTHTKGRVLLKLKPPVKQETIVSAERSADFKIWLDDGD